MAQQEKFNFYYTFQSTKFSNGIYNFDSIFYILFYFKKPFYAPCVSGWHHSRTHGPRVIALVALTGDKDPNTHQAHAGCIGSTDNK